MFLTRDELAELTDKRWPSQQIDWLLAHGYPHEISASGHPKVLKAYVERRLGLRLPKQGKQPNLTPAA